MRRAGSVGTLALGMAVLAFSGPYCFASPGTHTVKLGPLGGLTAWHKPGYSDPVANGCSECHGDGLGGLEGRPGHSSCYDCHGAFWDATQPQYPNSHDLEVTGNHHTPRLANCTFCHGIHGGGNKTSFWHKPGHGTPLQSGCGVCHGANLDGDLNGDNGFAFSCYFCHDRLWAGQGPPPDHTEDKSGFLHKPGGADPITNECTQCHGPNLDDGFAPSCFQCHGPGGGAPVNHNIELGAPTNPTNHAPGYTLPFENGCTLCHGPNLNDGWAPSCFSCHGATWDDHDFSDRAWLPAGQNRCYVCHGPPAFDPGNPNRDPGPEWYHALPTSTFVVSPITGQPNGTSVKCLGCHEGLPDGPAVDDYQNGPAVPSEWVTGPLAFGTDLTHHHPVSFTYDSALVVLDGGLNEPSSSPSGLTRAGTITEDMLDEAEQLQCTACHNPHDNTFGEYLVNLREALCFTCHTFVAAAGAHHIPGRDDPWGDGSGSDFNCTMCHGADLAGAGEVPGCETCHNPFGFPDAPTPGHHGGDRDLPYFDCASCHADPLTGVVTGNDFGTSFAPSCYQCHDDFWTHDNTPPDAPTMANLSGTVGEAVAFDASHIGDADGDPLAFEWNFGDGSPPEFPSHNPKTTHTYNDYGVFNATLAVTDGVAQPQYVQFTVTVEPATVEPAADTWTVDVASAPPETFPITFESHSGSLVGVKDDSSLAFGIEFVGVIFWMDMWMDLSGNVFWGTGDMFFGNINRELGTMEGVVFDDAGGVVTFSGTKL